MWLSRANHHFSWKCLSHYDCCRVRATLLLRIRDNKRAVFLTWKIYISDESIYLHSPSLSPKARKKRRKKIGKDILSAPLPFIYTFRPPRLVHSNYSQDLWRPVVIVRKMALVPTVIKLKLIWRQPANSCRQEDIVSLCSAH